MGHPNFPGPKLSRRDSKQVPPFANQPASLLPDEPHARRGRDRCCGILLRFAFQVRTVTDPLPAPISGYSLPTGPTRNLAAEQLRIRSTAIQLRNLMLSCARAPKPG